MPANWNNDHYPSSTGFSRVVQYFGIILTEIFADCICVVDVLGHLKLLDCDSIVRH